MHTHLSNSENLEQIRPNSEDARIILTLRDQVLGLKEAVRELSGQIAGKDYEGKLFGVDVTRTELLKRFGVSKITVVYPGRPFVWDYEEDRITVTVDKNHMVKQVVVG